MADTVLLKVNLSDEQKSILQEADKKAQAAQGREPALPQGVKVDPSLKPGEVEVIVRAVHCPLCARGLACQ